MVEQKKHLSLFHMSSHHSFECCKPTFAFHNSSVSMMFKPQATSQPYIRKKYLISFKQRINKQEIVQFIAWHISLSCQVTTTEFIYVKQINQFSWNTKPKIAHNTHSHRTRPHACTHQDDQLSKLINTWQKNKWFL